MAPVNSAIDPAITPATDITTNIGIHSRQSVVAAHARSERARQEFERRAQLLRECLCSEDFLANKGIGNEIGFHTFCYDPALEFEARALFDTLSRDAEDGKLPCTLKVVTSTTPCWRSLKILMSLSLCKSKKVILDQKLCSMMWWIIASRMLSPT